MASDQAETSTDIPAAKAQETTISLSPGSDSAERDSSEKRKLEIKKLNLELNKLKFDVSFRGRLSQYGQLVALCGLIWTIQTGYVKQNEDRVERAYTKLGASSAAERANGVAQLASLLSSSPLSWNKEKDREILAALVSQERSDIDPGIRNRIENVFRNLPGKIDKSVLNSTLQYVVDAQKELVESSKLTPFELAQADQDDHSHYLIPTDSFKDQLAASDQQQSLEQLTGLKVLLLSLLKSGAHVQDMSGIFCPGCDFTKTNSDLSGVNFSHSILTSTVWTSMQINGIDVRGARIEGAYFLGAHLKGAKFSDGKREDSQDEYILRTLKLKFDRLQRKLDMFPGTLNLKTEADQTLPYLLCTDLTGASLSHVTIAIVAEGFNDDPTDFTIAGADIHDADLRGATVLIVRKLSANQTPLSEMQSLVGSDKNDRYTDEIQYVDLMTDPGTSGVSKSQDALHRNVLQSVANSLLLTRGYDRAKLPEHLNLAFLPKPQPSIDCKELLKADADAIHNLQ